MVVFAIWGLDGSKALARALDPQKIGTGTGSGPRARANFRAQGPGPGPAATKARKNQEMTDGFTNDSAYLPINHCLVLGFLGVGNLG